MCTKFGEFMLKFNELGIHCSRVPPFLQFLIVSIDVGFPLLRYSNLSFFSRWRPSAILDLWGEFWDNPQREFGDLYYRAKYCWNRISCFYNTKV